MSDGLKACPFCGGVAEHSESRHQVWCSRCFVETIEHDATQEAIAAWNRRAVTREEYDAMREYVRDRRFFGQTVHVGNMLRAAGFEVAE